MTVVFSSTYLKLSPLVREHIAPACAVISVLVAISVGTVAIYTNINSLKMMARQQEQINDGQYQQYQGSVALAWRTIGEANGKAYEVGQSTSLFYLAQSYELPGNVTLNKSFLSLSIPRLQHLRVKDVEYFDLSKSSFCGTQIVKIPRQDGPTASANFAYSFMRETTLQGWFVSDDFLAADLQGTKLLSVYVNNARFAGADLRNALISGGVFQDSDFQGADLRGARTERGSIGAGSEKNETGWYDTSSEFSVGRIEWPSLFDPQNGLNEILTVLGQSSASEGGSYPVDVSKSNFEAADLRGAHLQNSNISQAQVNQACADETTELPTGRTVLKRCEFPSQYDEKLSAIRTPLRQNLLERSCAAALQKN